jgi:hypothetical protein
MRPELPVSRKPQASCRQLPTKSSVLLFSLVAMYMRDACGADAMLHSSSFLDTWSTAQARPSHSTPGRWIVEEEVVEEPYLPTYLRLDPEICVFWVPPTDC